MVDIVIKYVAAFSPYPTITATFYDCPEPCASICFQESSGNWTIGVVFDTTASPGTIMCKLEDSRGSSYTTEFVTGTIINSYVFKVSAYSILRSNLITPCDIESDYATGSELTALIKDYFDAPTYGQGTVTLSIKKPGQTLNFASRLLGETLSQYISGDAVVDMNTSPVITI